MIKSEFCTAVISYSYFLRDPRVKRYAQALAEKGYHADIIALKEEVNNNNSSFSFFLFPLKRRRFCMLWYLIEYILFFCFAFITLSIRAFRQNYQIIHVFNLPDFIVFAAIIPKFLGTKIILDIRDLSPDLFQTKYSVNKSHIFVRLLNFLEKYSFKFADYLITANPIFLERLKKKYPSIGDKISISYECADRKIFFPELTKQERKSIRLLYIGTIEPRFAIDLIIKSLPAVIQKIPNMRLIIIPKIIDEGRYFEEIKELVKSMDLENYIEIKLPLPSEKVAEEVRKADIGLVLVQKDPYTDIIHRTKLYEFIACKVPLIVAKTQLLSQFFSHDQLLFLKDNTPGELSTAIIKLSKDKKYRQKLANNAFSYYQKYNWEKEKKKYFALIKSLQ